MVDTKETHVWLTWLAPAGNLGGTGTPGGGFVVGGTPTTDSPPPLRVRGSEIQVGLRVAT